MKIITLTLTSALTLLTHTVFSQGSGQALNFDGNDYVNCGPANNLNITSDVTVSAWVKTGVTGYKWICGQYAGVSTTTTGFFIAMNNSGQFGIAGRDGSGAWRESITTGSYFDNDWHFVVGVIENGSWKIYVDGILENSVTTGFTNNMESPVADFEIGRYGNGFNTAYWDGNIDEIRLWNRALSETEIRGNMCKKLSGNEMGLIAYYRMDEGIDNSCSGGEDVCDQTSNGNHGTKF